MNLLLSDPAFLSAISSEAAPPPAGLLLDTYTGAAAAYSLRQLRTGVTNVVRVRRSSDNTEQDFTAAQVTDGTLTAFCGAGDGFVRTWYDQSGNNQDAIQVTAAEQPRIVDAGVLDTDGGAPAISLISSDFLQASSFSIAQPCSFAFVANKTNTSHYFDGETSRITAFGLPGNLYLFAGAQIGFVPLSQTRNVFTMVASSTDTIRVNGVQRLSGNAGASALSSLLIGRHSASINYMTGKFQELIIWPGDQSSVIPDIETSINSHYAIY